MTDTKAPAGMMGDTAPDRIWAVCDEDVSAQTRDIYAQDTPEGFVDAPTEYVRADLHASQQATIDALTEKVADIDWRTMFLSVQDRMAKSGESKEMGARWLSEAARAWLITIIKAQIASLDVGDA